MKKKVFRELRSLSEEIETTTIVKEVGSQDIQEIKPKKKHKKRWYFRRRNNNGNNNTNNIQHN